MKKNIQTTEFIAKTFFGLEQILANELNDLGAEQTEILNRAVKFQANYEFVYKANLYLRSALKLLLPIRQFKVQDNDSLYKGVKEIDWSKYFSIYETFAIDANISTDVFNHSGFVALKVKDAIADQFREKYGKRPSVDTENPTISINVHISDRDCTISLDTTGEPLFKRGYRTDADIAPLNEVLAAGMILLSGWDKESGFIDPMCGSGTIAIEAALYALNIAPNILRKNYAFQKWKNFDIQLWNTIYDQAFAHYQKQKESEYNLFASDKSNRAITIAKQNIENIGLQNQIILKSTAFEDLIPKYKKNIIIMNPPYNERIQDNRINELYAMIGERLKHRFQNNEAWILSSNFDALKYIGLRPSKKIKLFNGSLECKYQQYLLYEGSKKSSNINENNKTS